ncbi:hypothetical protein AOT83_23250 [Mycobacteroides sp. H001]|uniref:hypothetical protein n=1 Tax=Mycobacteroides TaxID=670516 RepID=UPI000713D74B|nr:MULTISPECIES: hypothetical protein [Mycobacteroides]KRQ19780.1 hypothetical protein AOT86_24380 [Mycobacteroides sp. H072]KRQ35132.1 hypothetical protein AOT84_17375 [Mycobacteroides sp. H002]KRQ54292.1 hypothetical protein AOT85_04910 [Mycobacteroides sp. H054]KRQ66417.1 hypothetical protein AOT83_23250 [Mycobacteroides sp. H001]OHU41054.1 hypothetical protein BKG79_08570 [Mycobacteroides chelonae]
MSDSPAAPGKFQWDQPEVPPAPKVGQPRRWGRWALVIAVVAVIVAGGVTALVWRTRGADPTPVQAGSIGTPPELLIDFALNRQPVPKGWTLSAAEIGLPPEATTGSVFARNGQIAYYLVGCSREKCGEKNSWVYGVDTATGALTFPPVTLPGYNLIGDCYGNGPGVALCLAQGKQPSEQGTVWIIDLDHGKITFTGPSNLRHAGTGGAGPEPKLRQLGAVKNESRLVAGVKGQGLYGIGAQGELTWHIPGSDVPASPEIASGEDIPAPTLAMAAPNLAANPSDTRYRVFSVADGRDLTPQPPPGTTFDKATVCNGGFAYEFSTGLQKSGVLFYDTNGTQVGRADGTLYLLTSAETPAALDLKNRRWRFFSSTGQPVLSVPATTEVTKFRTIGTKLYIQTRESGPDESWQQWDLQTGTAGPTCKAHLQPLDYVASDGTIAIWLDPYQSPGIKAAVDLNTCQTVWTTPVFGGENFEKVGNRLIGSVDEGKTLAELGAPA